MNQQLYDSLPERLRVLIDNQNYQEALESSQSTSEEQQVAELYLEHRFDNHWPLVQDSKDILVKLCCELGELDNDFVKLVLEYINKHGYAPGRNGMTTLNNLYSKDIIDDHNLNGTDEDGDTNKSILYNANLYNSNDSEFLTTSYYWLSQPDNIKRMKEKGGLNALASDPNVKAVVVDIAQLMLDPEKGKGVNTNALRNAIIYDITSDEALDNGATTSYKLRTPQEVRDILKVASNRNSGNVQQNERVSSLLADIARLNDSEKQELFNSLGLAKAQ